MWIMRETQAVRIMLAAFLLLATAGSADAQGGANPARIVFAGAGPAVTPAKLNMAKLDAAKLNAARPALTNGTKGLGALCLAAALYHEARGESIDGQRAVAQVILNRVRSRAYPDSICAVVYQNAHKRDRCQFSFACDTLPDYPSEREAFDAIKLLSAAILRKARHGYPAAGWSMALATHYHATYVAPSWSRRIVRLETVGQHIFYRSDRVVRRM